MKSKSAGKVKLTSFDDLFGTGEAAAGETVTSVPLSQLHTFKDHPFRVLDDEKMQETVESVKRYGVLMPGIVRLHPAGGYEVIAGHRRWRACELAGLTEIFPSKAQAEQLKAGSEAGELTEGKVYAVLVRKEESVNVTISAKKIRNYFPVEYSKEQIEDVIYTLLEEWKQKEGGTTDAGVTV